MFKNMNNHHIKMKKRGIGHHLDWIIGISLFMLYVIFMIVTLKPGIQPLHKGDTLLSIIQDRFTNATTWNVTKLELNINSAGCSSGIIYCSLNFPFSYDNSHTKIYNKADNSDAIFSISEPTIYIKSCDGLGTSFTPTKLKIIYSKEITGTGSSGSCSGGCCDSPSYIYGIPELITGLSEDKIDELEINANTNYEKLKNELNYPVTNDFNITIDVKGHKYEISNKNGPPQNINVYVRQFPEFILDSTGERIPVTLTITVW